jgi:hypothetical protein
VDRGGGDKVPTRASTLRRRKTSETIHRSPRRPVFRHQGFTGHQPIFHLCFRRMQFGLYEDFTDPSPRSSCHSVHRFLHQRRFPVAPFAFGQFSFSSQFILWFKYSSTCSINGNTMCDRSTGSAGKLRFSRGQPHGQLLTFTEFESPPRGNSRIFENPPYRQLPSGVLLWVECVEVTRDFFGGCARNLELLTCPACVVVCCLWLSLVEGILRSTH